VIGKTLGGRYEILERIGGGGMALVYKGHDLLLNRKVAVKVLRQQYVYDEEFIRRFRREAQSAASLSHPNVVSIYDVGQEEEIHYIVMEYIEGKTLNDLIKERAPLQVEEAIHIAAQICDALDHAHQNGIIHRDIKPHNILIGRNGRVKVTDFGIARAATSSTITQTGSVVGSVHYFSPEHAKGTQAGKNSDLYSLGIVLYQMLTAKLPFLGESPISVALKHLQEDVESPRAVNPLIPQSVENMIMKSLRKRPEERYQSAKDMMNDLETCLLPERRNEAKVQHWVSYGAEGGSDDLFDDADDDENTRIVPAIRSRPFTNSAPGDDFGDPFDDEEEEPRKKRGWIKPVVWIVVLLILLGGMIYLVKYVQDLFKVEEVQIPDLTGKKVTEAQDLLRDRKLKSKPVYEPNKDVPPEQVFKQYPVADMKVTVDSEVTLYVSKGPELVKMPGLKNVSLADGEAKLRSLGIDWESQVEINYKITEDVPDTILQSSIGAEEMIDPKKVEIKLTVSKAKETFPMPNLINKTVAEAKAEAEKKELKIDDKSQKSDFSYKIAKGRVIKTYPYDPDQEVAKGASISLMVSEGYPPDAGVMTVSMLLTPTDPSKPSVFKIMVSDARFDTSTERFKKTIDKAQTESVEVVVGPTTQIATVHVFENDVLVHTTTRSYSDFKNQQSGEGQG